MNTRDILRRYREGFLSEDEAAGLLNGAGIRDLGHTRLDLDRKRRTGCAEVVFGESKTVGQMTEIVKALLETAGRALVTRLSPEKAEGLLAAFPGGAYNPASRLLVVGGNEAPSPGASCVAVVSAGTSDMPVAEEAAGTLEFLGTPVLRRYDCGVAGLHRLLGELAAIRRAAAVVAVAGMEGALPGVVAGLVEAPVLAVPTSVGYGLSLRGVTPLLAMLNTCSSGVSVVNIDNGFGAGFTAHLIARQVRADSRSGK